MSVGWFFLIKTNRLATFLYEKLAFCSVLVEKSSTRIYFYDFSGLLDMVSRFKGSVISRVSLPAVLVYLFLLIALWFLLNPRREVALLT